MTREELKAINARLADTSAGLDRLQDEIDAVRAKLWNATRRDAVQNPATLKAVGKLD